MYKGEDRTAHFAKAEGVIYCYGIPDWFRERVEDCLPLYYRLECEVPFSSLTAHSRGLSRKAALIMWSPRIEKRVRFLVDYLRENNHCLPICLWSPKQEEGPNDLLAEGNVDYISRCETPSQIVPVLQNLLLRSEKLTELSLQCSVLSESSARDSLTSLYNHGRILRELENEFRRSKRSNNSLACLMLDIDHFKIINDTYGHRFGDYILKELARLLKSQIRATDIAGRYGGEEFLIILPDADPKGAENLAEKLRMAVERHSFRAMDVETIVTVSIGVAATGDNEVNSAEELLTMADRALYFAKESGRNRVATAGEHSSLSDFDVFRRQRQLADHAAPVAILATTDLSLMEQFASVAERDSYLLLTFADPKEFVGAVEALSPDLVLLDTQIAPDSPQLLHQIIARLSLQSSWIGVISDSESPDSVQPTLQKAADFIIGRDLAVPAKREILRLALHSIALERERVRLGQELKSARRRMRMAERMSALGEMFAGFLDEVDCTLSPFLKLRDKISDPIQRTSIGTLESLLQRFKTLSHTPSIIHLEKVFLAEFVRETLKEFQEPTPEKLSPLTGIMITNRIPDDFVLHVDRELFEAALCEIISNALDAMAGDGELTFHAKTEGEYLEICVGDTGHGIARDMVARIYEPFFTTRDRKYHKGLGVPIARAIVRQHGGELIYDSQPGRGTNTVIRLPQNKRDLDEPTLRLKVLRPF